MLAAEVAQVGGPPAGATEAVPGLVGRVRKAAKWSAQGKTCRSSNSRATLLPANRLCRRGACRRRSPPASALCLEPLEG